MDSHAFNFVAPLTPAGASSDRFVTVDDEFATRNRFYGGQIGARSEFRKGDFRFEVSGKLALGGVQQVVDIEGASFITNRRTPGINISSTGGLFALSTNIGRYGRSRFAVLPEADVNVGYQLTGNLRAFAGYNFLFINRVARPADQIDFDVSWRRVPLLFFITEIITPDLGPERPAFTFRDANFRAHGLTVGMRFDF